MKNLSPSKYFSVAVVVFLFMAAAAWAQAPFFAGQIVQGYDRDLKVSGVPAGAGTTLFNGDTIKTGSNPAVLCLNDGRRISLSPQSQVSIHFSDGKYEVSNHSGNAYQSGHDGAGNSNHDVVSMSKKHGNHGRGHEPSPSKPPCDGHDDDHGDNNNGHDGHDDHGGGWR